MSTPQELKEKLWKSLREDRTVMLGLPEEGCHLMPMTAQIDDMHGEVWFFTVRDNALAQKLGLEERPALFSFAAKGHGLFACVSGRMATSRDRAMIDRLWNPHVAAWYKGGKDDPQLMLLQFIPASAEIWLDEPSLLAGIKLLLGADPKSDYRGNTAEVRMN